MIIIEYPTHDCELSRQMAIYQRLDDSNISCHPNSLEPSALPGTFNFQCVVEGATARYWVALLAPIVPLLFLLACGVLESTSHGSGCLAEESLEHWDRHHLGVGTWIYGFKLYIKIVRLVKLGEHPKHIQQLDV